MVLSTTGATASIAALIHACMHDVLILFLHLIVVVRLAESVVAPNVPGNVGESVIENAA